jgi:hypothetical protein
MMIRLDHGLAYVEADLAFRGKILHLDSVILDTGSASTLFASDGLLELGIVPEPTDSLRRIGGIGGVEFVFTKRIDRLAVGEIAILDFEIQVGAMEYGFPAQGILGLDFLLRAGAFIDLDRLELHPARPGRPGSGR